MAEDHFADEAFDGPAVFLEVHGEVVEKLGMGRALTGLAEVVDRANDSTSEEVVPDPVDHDSRGQRVFFAGEPACQLEPTAGGGAEVGALLPREDLDEAAGHFAALIGHLAADADSAVDGSGGVADAHSVVAGRGGASALVLLLLDRPADFLDFLFELLDPLLMFLAFVGELGRRAAILRLFLSAPLVQSAQGSLFPLHFTAQFRETLLQFFILNIRPGGL